MAISSKYVLGRKEASYDQRQCKEKINNKVYVRHNPIMQGSIFCPICMKRRPLPWDLT